MKRLIIIICLLIGSYPLFAQDANRESNKAVQDTSKFMHSMYGVNSFMQKFMVYAPLPVISSATETGLLIGLVKFNDFKIGVTTKNDTITQPSTVSGLIYFTEKGQSKFNVETDLMLKENVHNISSRVTFFNFPLLVFGVGNDTHADTSATILFQNFEFEGGYKYMFKKKHYAGLKFQYYNSLKVEFVDSTENPNNYDVSHFQGVRSGLGFSYTFEGRDNRLNAYEGAYVNVVYDMYPGWLPTSFEFSRLLIDLRKYYTLIKPNKLILAGQFVSEFVTGQNLTEGAPLQALAFLGGPSGMRGYYAGRFRDYNSMSAQVEVRFPIFWIIGGTIFGAGGQVMPKVSDFNFSRNHYAWGGGLRLMISEKNRVNMRLDVGFGEDITTFTLGFSEAF